MKLMRFIKTIVPNKIFEKLNILLNFSVRLNVFTINPSYLDS